MKPLGNPELLFNHMTADDLQKVLPDNYYDKYATHLVFIAIMTENPLI